MQLKTARQYRPYRGFVIRLNKVTMEHFHWKKSKTSQKKTFVKILKLFYQTTHHLIRRRESLVIQEKVQRTKMIKNWSFLPCVTACINRIYFSKQSCQIVRGLPYYKSESFRNSLITCIEVYENSIIKHSIFFENLIGIQFPRYLGVL